VRRAIAEVEDELGFDPLAAAKAILVKRGLDGELDESGAPRRPPARLARLFRRCRRKAAWAVT